LQFPTDKHGVLPILSLKLREIYKKDRNEINRVKPLDIGLDKRKTVPIGTAFPVMSG